MAEKNISEIFRACHDGDELTVRRLLPRTSVGDLIRQESNGSTPLHAASANNHTKIVDLLLGHGVPRRIYDANRCTPLDLARTEEIRERFRRLEAAAQQRFSQNPAQQTEWLFGEDIAEDYARAIAWGCIKDRGIKKTMRKLEKNDIIPNDESKESKLLRFYFNEAREKNDPTFLLKAYTVESPFYRYLNDYMATGGKGKVFEKLCGKWSGYYTGAIVRNPILDPYRFSGITYRGMEVTADEVEQYIVGGALANKAFQSTSKDIRIAYSFACREKPTRDKVSLILIYEIRDRRAAIDITLLSEYQDEQEVLLVPGTLFRVDSIDKSTRPIQIQLRQLTFNN